MTTSFFSSNVQIDLPQREHVHSTRCPRLSSEGAEIGFRNRSPHFSEESITSLGFAEIWATEPSTQSMANSHVLSPLHASFNWHNFCRCSKPMRRLRCISKRSITNQSHTSRIAWRIRHCDCIFPSNFVTVDKVATSILCSIF